MREDDKKIRMHHFVPFDIQNQTIAETLTAAIEEFRIWATHSQQQV
jgi:hypothetical protein